MITLIAGIVLVGFSIYVALSTANPIAAVPLLFIGGAVLLAGIFSLKGGIDHAFEGLATMGMRTCSKCERLTPRNVQRCRRCGATEP